MYANKSVVEAVTDDIHQISLAEAQSYDDTMQLGEIFQIDITPPNFGRIATRKARQAMQQALRATPNGVSCIRTSLSTRASCLSGA